MKTTHNSVIATICMVTGTALFMTACSTAKPPAKEYSQDRLVESVRVPAGHVVVLETTGVGVLNYECRANASATGGAAWAIASPKADLIDRTGKNIGTYSGPPATWTHSDGSSLVGEQLALSPVLGGDNIAAQLSKGVSSSGNGAMQGITYIQRINTKGGQGISKACAQVDIGDKLTLPYQADYVFWKAM